jgi:hypothetical protein
MENVVSFINIRKRKPGDCVMFDIDDTLIDAKTEKTITHVKKLLDLCIYKKYKVAIITARPPLAENMKWTEQQLKDHSIRYDFLGFCAPQDKTLCKQHLTQTRGWNFVLSVGDQPTDLTDSEMYLLVT